MKYCRKCGMNIKSNYNNKYCSKKCMEEMENYFYKVNHPTEWKLEQDKKDEELVRPARVMSKKERIAHEEFLEKDKDKPNKNTVCELCIQENQCIYFKGVFPGMTKEYSWICINCADNYLVGYYKE